MQTVASCTLPAAGAGQHRSMHGRCTDHIKQCAAGCMLSWEAPQRPANAMLLSPQGSCSQMAQVPAGRMPGQCCHSVRQATLSWEGKGASSRR